MNKLIDTTDEFIALINGSAQMECMLLYTYLEASSDCSLQEQLHCLQSQGLMPFLRSSCYNDDVELETDGNRSGHMQNGDAVFDHEVNNEAIRMIAARLVAIGDRFDQEIKARVVNDLVQHFQNANLPREDLIQRVSEAVFGLLQAMPPDMEQEEAMLVLVMVLTKKIVNTVPSLLQRVFSTTVIYINQQLHNYIARMLRD